VTGLAIGRAFSICALVFAVACASIFMKSSFSSNPFDAGVATGPFDVATTPFAAWFAVEEVDEAAVLAALAASRRCRFQASLSLSLGSGEKERLNGEEGR
jgi:hypothetical protein